jgi:hypothetical protein
VNHQKKKKKKKTKGFLTSTVMALPLFLSQPCLSLLASGQYSAASPTYLRISELLTLPVFASQLDRQLISFKPYSKAWGK